MILTGMAMLHGTKRDPEAVLSAKETQTYQSFASALQDLTDGKTGVGVSSANQIAALLGEIKDAILIRDEETITPNIDIDVTFESGVISSDYDMDQAIRKAKQEIQQEFVDITLKTGKTGVSRRG